MWHVPHGCPVCRAKLGSALALSDNAKLAMTAVTAANAANLPVHIGPPDSIPVIRHDKILCGPELEVHLPEYGNLLDVIFPPQMIEFWPGKGARVQERFASERALMTLLVKAPGKPQNDHPSMPPNRPG